MHQFCHLVLNPVFLNFIASSIFSSSPSTNWSDSCNHNAVFQTLSAALNVLLSTVKLLPFLTICNPDLKMKVQPLRLSLVYLQYWIQDKFVYQLILQQTFSWAPEAGPIQKLHHITQPTSNQIQTITYNPIQTYPVVNTVPPIFAWYNEESDKGKGWETTETYFTENLSNLISDQPC